ncbi:MAG TPA: PQQ-binding-like beta-propeller repeat protein [Glycomyces sp.]|nr:PQQ-binding-like beta-propeller repeat protein [Glycomyces sp.]
MRRLITLFALFGLVLASQIPAGAIESDLPKATASFDDHVLKTAYDGDVLYVGGAFTNAIGLDGTRTPRRHLAAVDSVGGGLLPFAPDLDGQVHEVATAAGYLYAAGDFRHVDGVSMPRLARFDLETGELDEDWRPGPSASVLAVEPAGDRVYLGGRFASVGGHGQPYLAAVSAADGAVIPSFAPRVQEGAVRDIESGHGRLYVSGGFSRAEGEKQFGKLAAFDPSTGRVDRSFQADVYVLTRQIAVDGDRVYAALDGRGGEVRAFDDTGEALWYQAVDGGMQAVAVWGGTVIAGGHFDKACVTNHSGPSGECVDGIMAPRGKLLAVDRDGRLLSWNPDANGVIGVWDLQTHPEGASLAAGGTFTTFAGGAVQQRRLAVFD